MINNQKADLRMELRNAISYVKELEASFAEIAQANAACSGQVLQARAALLARWSKVSTLQHRHEELLDAIHRLEEQIATVEYLDVHEFERIVTCRSYQQLQKRAAQKRLQICTAKYQFVEVKLANTSRVLFSLPYERNGVNMLMVFLEALDALSLQLLTQSDSSYGRSATYDEIERSVQKMSVTDQGTQNGWRQRIKYILAYAEALAASEKNIEATTAAAFLDASEFTKDNLDSINLTEHAVRAFEINYDEMLSMIRQLQKFEHRELKAERKAVFQAIAEQAFNAGFKVKFHKRRFIIVARIDRKKCKFWRWYTRSAVIKVGYNKKGAVLAYRLLQSSIQAVAKNDDKALADAEFEAVSKELLASSEAALSPKDASLPQKPVSLTKQI